MSYISGGMSKQYSQHHCFLLSHFRLTTYSHTLTIPRKGTHVKWSKTGQNKKRRAIRLTCWCSVRECVSVYMCVCVSVCMWVCACVCACECVRACVRVCVRESLWVFVCECACVWVCVTLCFNTCVFTHSEAIVLKQRYSQQSRLLINYLYT